MGIHQTTARGIAASPSRLSKKQRKAVGQARREFKQHPRGLRCPICGAYVQRLQKVTLPDGQITPGCAACAGKNKGNRPGSGQHRREAWVKALRIKLQTVPSPLTADRISEAEQDRIRKLFAPKRPTWNDTVRPIRREWMRPVAGKVRRINLPATPAVIVISETGGPTGYDPAAIEKANERMQALFIELGDAERALHQEPCHRTNWERDGVFSRFQHAALVYASLLTAV